MRDELASDRALVNRIATRIRGCGGWTHTSVVWHAALEHVRVPLFPRPRGSGRGRGTIFPGIVSRILFTSVPRLLLLLHRRQRVRGKARHRVPGRGLDLHSISLLMKSDSKPGGHLGAIRAMVVLFHSLPTCLAAASRLRRFLGRPGLRRRHRHTCTD